MYRKEKMAEYKNNITKLNRHDRYMPMIMNRWAEYTFAGKEHLLIRDKEGIRQLKRTIIPLLNWIRSRIGLDWIPLARR